MKPQHSSSCERTSLLPPSKLLVLHSDSRPIFKTKPKIRIIHIVAPEIIRTDVENFRELVQRLTGKPAESWKGIKKKKTKEITTDRVSSHEILPPNVYTSKTSKFVGGSSRIMKKESEEILNESENNPNAFLNFLDVDSFIHDMNEYPLLPSQISGSTYGEVHLC